MSHFLDVSLNEVWRAELPTSTDVYANPVSVVGDVLQVSSWQGWTCDIDSASGRIIRKQFTK